MVESSDPKTKLEIRYHGGHAGNTYAGSKTKEEVLEIIERFLDLSIEGLGLRFEWVISSEAEDYPKTEAKQAKPTHISPRPETPNPKKEASA